VGQAGVLAGGNAENLEADAAALLAEFLRSSLPCLPGTWANWPL
jgi:hypothetical protein